MKPPNATPKPNRNEVKDEENLRLGVNCLFSMDSFFLLQFRKEMAGRLQFKTPLIRNWIILKKVFKESSLQFYAVNIRHHTFKLH